MHPQHPQHPQHPRHPQPWDRLGLSGLSRYAIRHYRLLLIFAVGIALIGSMAWLRIPRREDPVIEPPIVFASVPYPGAAAEDVEAQVVRPIEEALRAMDGVELIESSAYPNYALFTMRFESSASMETVTESVR